MKSKYRRPELLNLAHETGVPIRSEKDLIDFEGGLIVNGDLEGFEHYNEYGKPDKKANDETIEETNELVKQIHKSLFGKSTTYANQNGIEQTKAQIMLQTHKRIKKK